MFKKWFKFNREVQPHDINWNGIPETLIKLNGKREEGPNCWNATIMFFDPDQKPQFTSCNEMIEWLNIFTTIDSMKFQAVGSILAMYQDGLLIHTAVYVGPGILFHKRGMGGHWEFVTERQIRKIYYEANQFEYRLFKEIA